MGRRLTLLAPSLAFGGAERVVANMADHWAAQGDEVTVITLSGTAGDTYTLTPTVNRVPLDLMRPSHGPIDAVSKNITRIQHLRREIHRSAPDTVISFTDRLNVTALLACRPLGVDLVIAERSNPEKNEKSRLWNWLGRRMYPTARALVVQTERVRELMQKRIRGKPVYVIPNFVERPTFDHATMPSPPTGNAPKPTQTILGVGRLSFEKGFDRLIVAFSRIAIAHPSWQLTILGEGPERPQLERLTQSLGLSGRVRLPGWEPHPAAMMQQADLFVLPSRYEGFPNALLEAMANGMAVVSVDCDSGPTEIIRNEMDGLLVANDVDALSRVIERAILNEPLRRRLGEAAVNVVERFSIERYFSRWDAVLRQDPTGLIDP